MSWVFFYMDASSEPSTITAPKLDYHTIRYEMSASLSPHPNVSVPPDILSRPREERIQLAIAAIQGSGTKPNGDPCYSARQAERHFNISRSSLGHRLQGM
jgi:hypothetical protein